MTHRKKPTVSTAAAAPQGPLSPAVYHILLALAPAERHGYGILQEAAALAGGALRLPPATLYRSLQQLLDAGWIEESDERPDPELDDERRRYYRLSPSGRDVLRADSVRLAALVGAARARRVLSAADLRAALGSDR
ncbi:MAG: helix-turn-helix transcriptional regulator [Planctomycetota bacterium]